MEVDQPPGRSVISEEGSHASEENWKSDTDMGPV